MNPDLITCSDCARWLHPAEAWRGNRCEACALAKDPCACPACKGHGTRWTPDVDHRGVIIRRLAVCDDCGGEG